jgi:hypothetical protein
MTKERVVVLWKVGAGLKAMKNAFGPETILHRRVALPFVIPSEAEGSAVHSIGHQSQRETLLPLCHPDRSEAERRDLRFRGPYWKCF